MQRWKNADGSFQVTKNEFPDSARVGYQNASSFNSYNANVMLGAAETYNAITRTATPLAAPAEIGGYSLSAGHNFWSALGIDRIGTTGFDTRLGPSDGIYNGTDGVSFAPTWQGHDGSWKYLAGQGTNYNGSFATLLASPVLTIDRIIWSPRGGVAGPGFTQTLTITPDGILSRATSTAAGSWGMTLPLLADDGTTMLKQSLDSGIASVSGLGSRQSFIALDPTATLTGAADIPTSYGNVTPIRATGTHAEQDIFVYRNRDPITAASRKAGFAVIPTGYTSRAGWVRGNGRPDATFSTGVDFILQLSRGRHYPCGGRQSRYRHHSGQVSYALDAYIPVTVHS